MAFSQAQYEAVVDKINHGISTVSGTIDEILPAAQAGVDHWYVPGVVQDAVMSIARHVITIAHDLLQQIDHLLVGVAAPVLFFGEAFDWENVRAMADGVSGEIQPTAMPSSQHWTGAAQQAYTDMMAPQSTAAGRIASVADSTSTALGVCAVAGLAFYIALGLIIAQFIMSMIAVIAAFGSVAFSWAGLALAVGETSLSGGLIAGAVVALIGVLTAQAQQMASLHGEATDDSTFPGGKWPDPQTSTYSYAS
jgi:hypothetical protein